MLLLLASWRSACASRGTTSAASWSAGRDEQMWPSNHKNWPTLISARNHDLIDLLSRLTLYGAALLGGLPECRRYCHMLGNADSTSALLLDREFGSHINWATDIPLRVSLPE